jgi:UDP-glucuronate decarboxylase
MSKKVIFDKKISLVLGGAGFIGSNLCEELLKTSKVICVDNFSSSSEANIDHLLAESDFEFINHDMSEPIVLDSLPELQKFKIKFQGIQEIFNLACPMSIKGFPQNRVRTLLANSLAVKNALDLALYYDASLVHFSSSAVYGPRNEEKRKFLESDLVNLDFLSEKSAFDEGRRFAETMVMNYRRETGVKAKIARIFNIYGPRMPLGDGQMIPDFIDAALDNTPLTIHGDENTSSSFCYISDCIDACLKLINSDFYGPVNIGSDVDVKLSEIAKRVIVLLDSQSTIAYDEKKDPLTPYILPDISMARDKIGWLPVVSLEKGLKDAVYHIRANKGIKNLSNAVVDFLNPEEPKD